MSTKTIANAGTSFLSERELAGLSKIMGGDAEKCALFLKGLERARALRDEEQARKREAKRQKFEASRLEFGGGQLLDASDEFFDAADAWDALKAKGVMTLARSRFVFRHGLSRAELKAKYYGYLQQALYRERGELVQPVWYEEHERILDWLMCNEGQGLLLSGATGVGKSLICEGVLYPLLRELTAQVPLYSRAVDLPQLFDELGVSARRMGTRIFIIDDVGTEDMAWTKDSCGQRMFLVNNILDIAEKHGSLVIMTTNLNREELIQRYGARTNSRRKLMRAIGFAFTLDLRHA